MTKAQGKWSNVDWRQAAGDAFLLLIGVLLALGGQAWWEARAERKAMLRDLRNDCSRRRKN